MNGFSFLNELNTKSNFVIVINSFFHLFFIYYISPGTRAPTFKELTFCVIEMKNTSYRYNCYTWIIREALIWGYHTVFWKYRGNWLTAQEGNIYLTKKKMIFGLGFDMWILFQEAKNQINQYIAMVLLLFLEIFHTIHYFY